ncbi:MAG TPA: hypothetical protein DCE42_17065 [Myxococcales bacterium]|mgnify:CR=1 FL=1|nr:hypothetical protein [Deltaproteobacteria bacterium]MBU49628.1 hypothetical protein [Deltaproteobacteria bacterium]HAA56479.1 hypothetical protein [Myxococcales bacterium]|tara:strand:- start:250 stop:990 length:741 start_codon:yes stop_codon:yes gene_type:complete
MSEQQIEAQTLYKRLLARLDRRKEAVALLLRHPEHCKGAPPPELLTALKRYAHDPAETITSLAKAWERAPLCDDLLGRFLATRVPKAREEWASLLPIAPSHHAWETIYEVAARPFEIVEVKRYMFEALGGLLDDGLLSWDELGELLEEASTHSNPRIRAVVATLLGKCSPTHPQLVLLCHMLDDANPWVLAAGLDAVSVLGAHPTLAHMTFLRFERLRLLEEWREIQKKRHSLLTHPHPVVRASVG